MHVMRCPLATGSVCSVSVYRLHLEKPVGLVSSCVVLCLLLQLLYQPGESLWLLAFSSSLLAFASPTMGSANNAHSEIEREN